MPIEYTLRKALTLIIGSVLLISGSCGLAILYYRYVMHEEKIDASNNIVAIVQSSPDNEGVQTVFFAEMLNLSVDHPINLYNFSAKEAQKKLLEASFINQVSVSKIRPGMIHVNYVMRKPIAFLGDYTNTLVDAHKVTFPYKPFYTPKRLPELILGRDDAEPKLIWGTPLVGEKVDLAYNLLSVCTQACCDGLAALLSIDVSDAFALTYGKRHVVIAFEDHLPIIVEGNPATHVISHIVRLPPDNYLQQLANYCVLRNHLREQFFAMVKNGKLSNLPTKPLIIDLRLPELAFITQ